MQFRRQSNEPRQPYQAYPTNTDYEGVRLYISRHARPHASDGSRRKGWKLYVQPQLTVLDLMISKYNRPLALVPMGHLLAASASHIFPGPDGLD